MNVQSTTKKLRHYLINLQIGIEKGHKTSLITQKIETEADLARCVQVGNEGDSTLLRILGYRTDPEQSKTELKEGRVLDHIATEIWFGRTKYIPDYVLKSRDNSLLVLEIKRPDESVDSSNQVLSYCQGARQQSPLGVMFNGRQLRVFINTKIDELKEYETLFATQPIASADISNIDAMAALLSEFTFSQLKPNGIATAKRLAEAQIAILQDQERKSGIFKILSLTIGSQCPVEATDIVSVLAQVTSLWSKFDPEPDDNELVSVWNEYSVVSPQSSTSVRTGVNPKLREEIVKVYGARGWSAIVSAQIRGLRYNLNDDQTKGYRPVPQGVGVPMGLCVQGLPSAEAKRIIEELQGLL